MPSYRVVSGFCVAPGRDVYPGDTVELTEREAAAFVYQQRLVPADGAKAPATASAEKPDPKSDEKSDKKPDPKSGAKAAKAAGKE